jgi:DinB superfamily
MESSMLDRECTLHAFVLRYCRRLVDDVPDAEMADQPTPGATHPAWVLGHLAIAADFAVVRLGGSPACSPAWRQLFGPGSSVLADRGAYPSKEELLAAVTSGHDRVVEAARRATPEILDRPQPGPFYLEDFPTVGDLVAYLMTTHSSLHLGQLSAWRRMKGLPSALGI